MKRLPGLRLKFSLRTLVLCVLAAGLLLYAGMRHLSQTFRQDVAVLPAGVIVALETDSLFDYAYAHRLVDSAGQSYTPPRDHVAFSYYGTTQAVAGLNWGRGEAYTLEGSWPFR